MKKSIQTKAVLILLATTVSTANAALYRYKNNEGVTVLDNHIPTEFIANGYEVLDNRGFVIETVKPIEETAKQGKSEAELKAMQAAQQREDLILLRSYSSTEEIESHKQRKVNELQKQVDFLTLERDNTDKSYQALREQAAVHESRKEAVPEKLSAQLEAYTKSLNEVDAMLQKNKSELQAIVDEFQGRIDRYRQLTAPTARINQTTDPTESTDE